MTPLYTGERDFRPMGLMFKDLPRTFFKMEKVLTLKK